MYQIHPCSPAAKALITSYEDKAVVEPARSRLAKYPFREMKIGDCFLVPFGEMKGEQAFRVMVHERGKKLEKKFTVIKHAEHQIFEVARIA